MLLTRVAKEEVLVVKIDHQMLAACCRNLSGFDLNVRAGGEIWKSKSRRECEED